MGFRVWGLGFGVLGFGFRALFVCFLGHDGLEKAVVPLRLRPKPQTLSERHP